MSKMLGFMIELGLYASASRAGVHILACVHAWMKKG
jgi:hypothetical protein